MISWSSCYFSRSPSSYILAELFEKGLYFIPSSLKDAFRGRWIENYLCIPFGIFLLWINLLPWLVDGIRFLISFEPWSIVTGIGFYLLFDDTILPTFCIAVFEFIALLRLGLNFSVLIGIWYVFCFPYGLLWFYPSKDFSSTGLFLYTWFLKLSCPLIESFSTVALWSVWFYLMTYSKISWMAYEHLGSRYFDFSICFIWRYIFCTRLENLYSSVF